MTILSNIGTALFLIAFILLILCIISFFKKNGKAKQYGRPAVILFMISIVLIITSADTSNNPIVEFFSILSFVLFVFFLVLAILSVIKKTGVAKKQFIITAILFVIFGALSSISNPTSEKTTATSKKVASNTTEQKDSDKKELEKKEADEKAQKQEDEKRQAEEQARKQEDEKRQADEQARKQQEEQKRLADEQTRKQQEEQKRQADEQARKQQEEQKRLADEQARKQQEEQKKAQQVQTQPAAGNTSNAYYKNCAAVRAAGKAPLYKGQPGYDSHLDRDGDGVACEK
ncbi:excalibur calcium-binding domain-containing protein [Bacillus tropicus]|uniref:excalibur calcium-binding domain-containing protein n=1 Tax=Bacillus cereus group TaxID=86661 RepID=UPI000CD980E0|nr:MULTISPECIES: excalibur calcium-binding domain-containing protein [Bacillus cereus group]MDA1805034.1 excalibur calcium-binding domain-containing protein [Bacillus cereus group sp. BY32LC]MDF9558407.1 excalibur calcium-binding domain-containing protein [Bacillus tropicus]MDF9589074.1 excalibur calcium-binding domain-containing protein [Bacillus tropicus]MDF9646247.1 excalibur calcium-binding domain-containing protein [Bacillus tropicus]